MKITSFTKQGRRDYQEDRYLVKKLGYQRYFLAVFDGHGGDACSTFCRQRLSELLTRQTTPSQIKVLINKISEEWDKKCLDFLSATKTDINKQWRDNLPKHPKWDAYEKAGLDSGTTFCSAYITSEYLYIVSIGDSQAVWKFDNKKTEVSLAHKPSKYSPGLIIPALIKRPNVNRINGVLAVGRALGDNGEDTWGSVSRIPLMKSVPLSFKKSFKLVVGTDGVWDCNVTYPSVMKKHNAHQVVDYAYRSGSEDNITVIMMIISRK